MESFVIKYADVTNTKNGEKLRLKNADGSIVLWLPSTHKDQAALKSGVTVNYQRNEKGYLEYLGIASDQPAPASPANPPAPTQPKPTAGQLAAMYVKIWAELEPLQLDAEGHRQATATVFIAATGAGIYE